MLEFLGLPKQFYELPYADEEEEEDDMDFLANENEDDEELT